MEAVSSVSQNSFPGANVELTNEQCLEALRALEGGKLPDLAVIPALISKQYVEVASSIHVDQLKRSLEDMRRNERNLPEHKRTLAEDETKARNLQGEIEKIEREGKSMLTRFFKSAEDAVKRRREIQAKKSELERLKQKIYLNRNLVSAVSAGDLVGMEKALSEFVAGPNGYLKLSAVGRRLLGKFNASSSAALLSFAINSVSSISESGTPACETDKGYGNSEQLSGADEVGFSEKYFTLKNRLEDNGALDAHIALCKQARDLPPQELLKIAHKITEAYLESDAPGDVLEFALDVKRDLGPLFAEFAEGGVSEAFDRLEFAEAVKIERSMLKRFKLAPSDLTSNFAFLKKLAEIIDDDDVSLGGTIEFLSMNRSLLSATELSCAIVDIAKVVSGDDYADIQKLVDECSPQLGDEFPRLINKLLAEQNKKSEYQSGFKLLVHFSDKLQGQPLSELKQFLCDFIADDDTDLNLVVDLVRRYHASLCAADLADVMLELAENFDSDCIGNHVRLLWDVKEALGAESARVATEVHRRCCDADLMESAEDIMKMFASSKTAGMVKTHFDALFARDTSSDGYNEDLFLCLEKYGNYLPNESLVDCFKSLVADLDSDTVDEILVDSTVNFFKTHKEKFGSSMPEVAQQVIKAFVSSRINYEDNVGALLEKSSEYLGEKAAQQILSVVESLNGDEQYGRAAEVLYSLGSKLAASDLARSVQKTAVGLIKQESSEPMAAVSLLVYFNDSLKEKSAGVAEEVVSTLLNKEEFLAIQRLHAVAGGSVASTIKVLIDQRCDQLRREGKEKKAIALQDIIA